MGRKGTWQSWRRVLAAVMATAMVLTTLPQSALMARAEESAAEQGVTTEQDAMAAEMLEDWGTDDGEEYANVRFVVEHATVREYDKESGQSKDVIPNNTVSVVWGKDFYYTIEPEAGYKVSDVAYKSGNSSWDFDLNYGVICTKEDMVVYVTVEPIEKHTISFEASDLSGLSVLLDGEETAFAGSTLEVNNTQRFAFTLQAKETGKAYFVTYKRAGDKAESVYSYETIFYDDESGQELICQEFGWAGFVEKDMTIKIVEADLAEVTVQRVGDLEYIEIWGSDDVGFLWVETGDGETENSQRLKIPAGYGVVLNPVNDSMNYEYQELVTTVTAKDKEGNEQQVSKQYSDESGEYVYHVTITDDMIITATGELQDRKITIDYLSDQGEVKVFNSDGKEIELTDRDTFACKDLGTYAYITLKIKAYDDSTRPCISWKDVEGSSWEFTLQKDCLDDEGWYCSNLYNNDDAEGQIYLDNILDACVHIDFLKYHKLTIKNPDLPAGKLQLYRLYYNEYDGYYTDDSYYDGEGLLPKEEEIKEYTIEGASGVKYMLAFDYSKMYKVDFSCTAGGVMYTPEICTAQLEDERISFFEFDFTEDVTLNIQATEKKWYEVTVNQTENVQKDASIEGDRIEGFGDQIDACQSTEDGKYRVLEDSKVYISLDTVNPEHRGTLTITTSDGKNEKLPYKSNYFEVPVTSDMTISLDAEAAETHTLRLDDASHLQYCSVCICTNGEKSEIEGVEGSYTICDAEEYRIYFEENPGKRVSKAEVQYGSQTSKDEKKICYDNGEDLYYCDLGYGTEDMTVYFTYEDVCTVSFQSENVSIYERGDWENSINFKKLSLAHGESLEFLVGDGFGNRKVIMNSDSFTLVRRQYHHRYSEDELANYYYYILTPVEGKELPKELVVTVETPNTAHSYQDLTLVYDSNLCDVGLWAREINSQMYKFRAGSLESEVPINIRSRMELVLCVSPLGSRDVAVTKTGEEDDVPVEVERTFMKDESSYYYIGNVTEATRIDITVSPSSVKREYYSVTFGSSGREYDTCYDVFESSHGICLDKEAYYSSGCPYQVEAGEAISFYYLTNDGYQITAAQTNDETQPVLPPVYDEAADTYIYTVVPTKDMKITPCFEGGTSEDEKNYSVSFDLQGHGAAIQDLTVKSGDKIVEPEEPKAEGYLFGGWYKEADCTTAWDFAVDVVTARTVLYAKWTKSSNTVKYIVSFDMQGHGNAIADITVLAGERVAAPATPTAAGYLFGGWYQDANCTQAWDFATMAVECATVLYAKWTASTFTVSYNMQGIGNTPDAITVGAGAKITAPTVSEVLGYLFQGWFKEAGCVTAWDFANDVVDRDMVLYAKWMKDPNTETPEDIDDSFYETSDRKDLKALGAAIGTIKPKTYDGNAYLPAVKVTVKDGNKTITLTEGTDYRVLYKNNINAGTGTVIVKGNGIYTGELKKEFTINKKPVNKLKVVVGGMGLNDKSAPPVYVYDGGKLLQEDEAYTLSYEKDMTAAKGTKKVTITATDKGNYAGSRTVNVKVYDAGKILNPENVKLDQVSFAYTGKALKPAVTVTYGGAMVDKKNYSVKYQNNKEAGIGYVIVTGKKEYGGSVVKTFEIKSSKTKFALKKPAANMTYNGKLQKPKVTVIVNDGNKTKTLKAGKDYTIAYSNNLHATTGSKQAVITIKGKGNYADTPTETFRFNILPQKIKKVSVKGTKGALTLTYAKRILKEGKDYEVSYGTENKGKVEVKIVGKGDFIDSVTKKVKIAAK